MMRTTSIFVFLASCLLFLEANARPDADSYHITTYQWYAIF
jgi:hypothetical protein